MRGTAPVVTWLVVFAVAASLMLAPTAAGQSSDLVLARPGTMPLILSAPHGGIEPIPGVPARSTGTTARDIRTDELTLAVSQRVESLLCSTPYVVVARFHRLYLDANRAPHLAFEHPDAAPHYAAYHASIRQYVAEVRQSYPTGGLLLDIHGQGMDPSTIHRGTRDGLTVRKLLETSGAEALVGARSIFGRLEASGYSVYPATISSGGSVEDPRYRGGHIVATYGSHTDDGVDAIQLEIGSSFRSESALPQLADDLGGAIADFAAAYLGANHCHESPPIFQPSWEPAAQLSAALGPAVLKVGVSRSSCRSRHWRC